MLSHYFSAYAIYAFLTETISNHEWDRCELRVWNTYSIIESLCQSVIHTK